MARTDIDRILGALLGGTGRGGLRPARRRRKTPPPLVDIRLGGSRGTARALATLAGAVLGTVLSGRGEAPPQPAPARGGTPPRPIDVASPMPPPGPLPNPWASHAGRPPAPAAPVADTRAEEAESLLILRAMISCAKADGVLDAAERGAIADQLDQAGLNQPARDLVLAEFSRPATVAEIAAAVSDPVLAAQVYAAAFLAAGEVTDAERGWLTAFARAAGLDPRAAAEIEKKLVEI